MNDAGTTRYTPGTKIELPVLGEDDTEPTIFALATKSGMINSEVVAATLDVDQVANPHLMVNADKVSVQVGPTLPSC